MILTVSMCHKIFPSRVSSKSACLAPLIVVVPPPLSCDGYTLMLKAGKGNEKIFGVCQAGSVHTEMRGMVLEKTAPGRYNNRSIVEHVAIDRVV